MFQCIEHEKGKLQQADGMSGHGGEFLKGSVFGLLNVPPLYARTMRGHIEMNLPNGKGIDQTTTGIQIVLPNTIISLVNLSGWVLWPVCVPFLYACTKG